MQMEGAVLLLTGQPCAGKTTLARVLVTRLGPRAGLLDGDEVRKTLCADLGFSREDRQKNLFRIGFVARAIARTGGLAVIAAVSPLAGARAELRRATDADGVRFFEVHVFAPLDELKRRDIEGRYARYSGPTSEYEPSAEVELSLDTSRLSVEACADQILRLLH
jgi:adenylylsulfate kinase-like enzyme